MIHPRSSENGKSTKDSHISRAFGWVKIPRRISLSHYAAFAEMKYKTREKDTPGECKPYQIHFTSIVPDCQGKIPAILCIFICDYRPATVGAARMPPAFVAFLSVPLNGMQFVQRRRGRVSRPDFVAENGRASPTVGTEPGSIQPTTKLLRRGLTLGLPLL